MNQLRSLAAASLWIVSSLGAVSRFRGALHQPRAVQEQHLLSLLRRNAASRYGQRYGFGHLRSIRDYQGQVPIVSYEGLANEIAAIKRGETGILTTEPVLMLEKTSGSSAAAKYIPYTASLRREFQAALAPWMADLYGHRPRMLRGRAYWSVSPLGREHERTEGGSPVGFADDREYFGAWARRLLGYLLPVPAEVARVPDMDGSRYATLRFLLEAKDLTFMSVWNPSFLALLIRFLQERSKPLIDDIRRGTLSPPSRLDPQRHALLARHFTPRPKRALELQRILDSDGTLCPAAVWPRLAVISCWASASARRFVPELKALFPGVEIQPKGLMATEGAVSIPLTGHPGGALAVTSHFFEFVDAESPGADPRLADELETGHIYSVIITTGGGLYRYELGDRIQVVGTIDATPLVEFLGRDHQTSDLCGEKLHERRVSEVLDRAFREFGIEARFALVAPEWGEPPGYVLFLEASGLPQERFREVISRVEAGLLEDYQYRYCRNLGQLRALRGCLIPGGGCHAFLERCAALGQRSGNVKPTALHRETGWTEWFTKFLPQHALCVLP